MKLVYRTGNDSAAAFARRDMFHKRKCKLQLDKRGNCRDR